MTSRRHTGAGAGILLLLTLLLFSVWASWFSIDQIVRANGQFISQERTQLIQVADGGVLRSLQVSEGEKVRKGQVLASLESERAAAGVEEIQNRIAGLEIARQRATAEADGEALDLKKYQARHADLVQAQRSLYTQNMLGLEKDTRALQEQIRLAREEYDLTNRLFKDGNISRVELMRTERALVDAEMRLDSAREKFKAEARKEVARCEDEITSQRSKLQDRQSVFDHTNITAPTDGIVKYLRINTIGGVLRPGEELMQISPTGGSYIVEAKINPADIGQLHIGQSATLRLDAFDYSIYGGLQGRLEYLSSDTLSETGADGRNQVYYRAKLSVEDPVDGRIRMNDIKPGMNVTIDLLAGSRSVLHYIAKPIAKAFSGALGQK